MKLFRSALYTTALLSLGTIASASGILTYLDSNSPTGCQISAKEAQQIKKDARELTADEKRLVRAKIALLRADGHVQEADALQRALDAKPCRIKMGDPRQMHRVAAMATDDGWLIISESWYNEMLKKKGGAIIIASMLLHEGLHLWQWEDISVAKYTSLSADLEYDPDAMEADAYELQIQYLEAQRDASKNPQVKENLQEIINFLKERFAYFQGLIGKRRQKPRNGSSFGDGLTVHTSDFPPRYALYYKHGANASTPEAGPTDIALMREADVSGLDWATMWSGPAAWVYAKHIVSVTGKLIAYDSRNWTISQYEAILGPQDIDDRTQIDVLRSTNFSLTTNPAVLGSTLSQVPAGVALFIFKSDFPEDIPYGYDKDGHLVHPNPAPDNREK